MSLFRRMKMCDNCKSVKVVKTIKSPEEYLDILEYIKGLVENGNYKYDGGNSPVEAIKYWPQNGLWYRIKCKDCSTYFTLWYDTFQGKGAFKKGK